jgi:hypothetical protein
MSVSHDTLTQLEACGVTETHLKELLRFLRCQRNGSWSWHGRNGQLEQCELRLVYPAKRAVVEEVGMHMWKDHETKR